MTDSTDLPAEDGFIDVSILVLPTVHASALHGAHDILNSADIHRNLRHCDVRGKA